MTIADKLRLIASNVQKVFDSGKKEERAAFWDGLQENGNRVNYANAFYKWSGDIFYPTRNFNCTQANSMFQFFNQYGGTGNPNFDLSTRLTECGVTLNFGGCSSLTSTFYYVRSTSVPEIDARKCTNFSTMFAYAYIETIEKIILNDTGASQNFTNMFQNCSRLKNITFEGIIGNSMDVHWASQLTVESLRSILKALSTNGSGKAITFATASRAIIESDTECIQYATAAKSAGWTFAYN